jgi:hypothetical protein
MTRLLFLGAAIAVLGLVLAFTKPTEARFQAELEARLLSQIDATELDGGEDPARAVLLATCKMSRTQCAQLIGSLATIDYADHVLFSRARIGLGDRTAADCIGVLTQILCRRP